MAAPSDGRVDISALSIEQLNNLKKQLEGDVQSISQDAQSLKVALSRFQSSKAAVMAIRPEDAGAEMLVPLTGSLFVPGRLASTSQVLVDVGTGYYVSKSVEAAKEFLEKKVEFVKNNLDALNKVIAGKSENLQTVTMMLQKKIQEQVGSQ